MLIKGNRQLYKIYKVERKNWKEQQKKTKRIIWNKYVELYSEKGFLPNGAKQFFKTLDNKYIQNKKQHGPKINFKFKGKLRDYQFDAVAHIYENKGGLIELKTGGGKSYIQMGIVDVFKRKTLIIVPTKKLVKEMYDKFNEFTSYQPGIYYSDKKEVKDITITTHMTFCKEHIKGFMNIGKYDVVIVDEADDKVSKKFINAICECDCNVLVGLTGTPKRQDLDRTDLELFYGKHKSVGGYQIKPTNITHYVYKRTQDEKSEIDYYSWHTQRESIISNTYRQETIINKIKEITSKSFLTLILMDRISEIDEYKKFFKDAVVITGKTKINDDNKNIEKVRETGGIIIGSRQKMYRGVDIQEIDHVIIASPVKFENNVIQSIGRGLRTSKNKDGVEISIINDSVLYSQILEQSKSCIKEYGIKPHKEYLFYKKD